MAHRKMPMRVYAVRNRASGTFRLVITDDGHEEVREKVLSSTEEIVAARKAPEGYEDVFRAFRLILDRDPRSAHAFAQTILRLGMDAVPVIRGEKTLEITA